jgi:RNA polymerase sigma factor (sigma-70 family)
VTRAWFRTISRIWVTDPSKAEIKRHIDQAIAGDSTAQSRFFKTHTPRLYRVAFNVLRNKEDAVQDTWTSAYLKLHAFEGRSSFSTWLTRIVINSALMIRRRDKYKLTSLDKISDEERGVEHYLVDNVHTPEEACREGEMNGLSVAWRSRATVAAMVPKAQRPSADAPARP